MAISSHASGTRTAGTPPEAAYTVLGTTTDTTQGIFQFFIDCSAMAKGDQLSIQVLEKVLSAGTQAVIYSALIVNAQDDPIWVSPSLILLNGWQLQIKQTLGTARSFPWDIRKVA